MLKGFCEAGLMEKSKEEGWWYGVRRPLVFDVALGLTVAVGIEEAC
jgi:hypothetical protein